MNQTDIFGNSALNYFEQFDAFKILETSVIDSTMIDLWNSKLDTSGSFFEISTGINIIKRAANGQMIDYEKKNRFYSERRVEEVKPHQFIFQKFCKSIHFKFLLEMIIWGILAFAFQYYITAYT